MEGAKELPDNTRDNAQEAESKPVGDKRTSKGEKFPSHATVAGGADKSENDRDMEDQADPIGEAVEPKIDFRSVVELEPINTETENEDTINTKTKSDEQTSDESAVEKLTENKVELIKQNGTNGGMKEMISSENSVENGHRVKNAIKEKPREDIAEEITDKSGGEGENVPAEENNLEDGAAKSDPGKNMQLLTDIINNKTRQTQSQNAALDEVPQGEDEEMEYAANTDPDKEAKDELKEQNEVILATVSTDGNYHSKKTALKNEDGDPLLSEAGNCSGQTVKAVYTHSTLPLMAEDDDGTPEEQAVFMKELERFYQERGSDFKQPKFYQQPLNCLKLWRAVIRLGGYEVVTGSKLWRQVGESFHPPKTCTTVSWTFRIFYEKSLLEFEKYQIQSNALQLPEATLIEVSGVDKERNGHQGSEPGKSRRDAASRAVNGWHSQRLYGNGEVGEPVIKNKNRHSTPKRERNFKNIDSLKQKRPNEVETSNKSARNEMPEQLVASVVDVGPPADWVKINVRSTTDCFEVYALVPGLSREEVKVQSDPAGCLVITGQPEQLDNPWGITPFKKVVSLPSRIDPLHTSAVVSLHGGLFVRVPYEQ